LRTVPLNDLVLVDAPICYGILMPGKHVPDGVPVVKVRDYERHQIDSSVLLRTSEEIDRQYARSRLRGGDILVSIRGTTGRVAVAPDGLGGANITQDSARVRVPPEHRQYVYHMLRSPFVQRQIESHTIGQAVQGINIASVRKLEIPWFRDERRDAIVRVHDAADRAVDVLRQLMLSKRALKRGLMQDLLTGRRRFPTHSGSGAWKEIALGQLLERVLRPIQWNDAKEYRLLSIRRRNGGAFHRETKVGRDIKTKSLFTVRTGDFIISRMQAVHGAMAHVEPVFDGYQVSGMYLVLRPKKPERIRTAFLHYASGLREMYRNVMESCHGVHIEKMTFDPKRFMMKRVLVPPTLEEQDRIVNVLRALDDEVAQLQALCDAYEKQRRGLMQRLLLGDLVLPESSPNAPALAHA